MATPLSGIGGPNKADMLHAFYKSWAGSRVRTVEAIIYGGYYQGLTSQQIVNQIRGTKLNRYRDGQIAAARKDVELLTRTAVQHAATQARMEVYDANSDVIGGIQIVATLDDRTTPQCRSMDGRVFKLDEEHIPLPPYHVGCRSTTVPVMRPPFDALDKGAKRIARGPEGSELVPADMTYYEWLKTQPASFQNDAIGPRRAELLRNGGLSAKRFSELNLSRNFQPLTLEEMKRVEPGAFERAANVKNNLLSGEGRGILDKGGDVGTEKGIRFSGAEAREEDTAFIETSRAPATFVKQVREVEATTKYVEDTSLKHVGLYNTIEDVIKFNPDHPAFPTTQERRARIRWHEVIHRGDSREYASWENTDFLEAIDVAKERVNTVIAVVNGKDVSIFDSMVEETKELTREDIVGVHDILSALRQGRNEGLFSYHDVDYWKADKKHTPMEIFANIGTLDLMNGKGLSVIKKYFPSIFNAYRGMVK